MTGPESSDPEMTGPEITGPERTSTATVRVEFEGQAILAHEGDSVAAVLLSASQKTFRETPVSGAARGAFCMMGICFDCLVEIDGLANIQACMTEVRDGMRIRRQRGARDIYAPDSAPDSIPDSAPRGAS